MGYSHYWKKTKQVDQKVWNSYAKVCKKLKDCTENIGISIVNHTGNAGTAPIFNRNKIQFNGENINSYESFNISINDEVGEFSFCKTNRKPYDILVVCCLIAAKLMLGYRIASDGDKDDLKEAIDFFNKIMMVNISPRIFNKTWIR